MAYVINHSNSNQTGIVFLVSDFPSPNFVNPSLLPVVYPHPYPPYYQILVPLQFALNPAMVEQIEAEKSDSLRQLMIDERLVPSPEEELKRKNVIEKLKELVTSWIKKVAYQRRLPHDQIRAASATVLTYGSYGLGVHHAESDIDALCVGPWFASMAEDFFIVLHNMLARRPEVSNIQCVKDAKVPLMRFKFEGISIDFPYAQLQMTTVPMDLDILNPVFLTGIDETSRKSLSGVRANATILHLVPDVKVFQEILRCLKLWAKKRGVYGNLFGFFGGVHLAVLVAFICQKNPGASLASLISIFFKTFCHWPWPQPVLLLEGIMMPPLPIETRSLMPIQLPSSPQEYCHSNIGISTFNKIRTELLRGHRCTKDFLNPQFDWGTLFEPYPYWKSYPWFMKICLSTSNRDELGSWVGWAKSRFRSLVLKLEDVHGYCDPNPTEYVDTNLLDPNVVFYWGAVPRLSHSFDLNSVTEDFTQNLSTGYQGIPGQVTLSLIQATELPKNLQPIDANIRANWRFSNVNDQQLIPVYSNHLPRYIVGYLATSPSPDQPGGV